MKFLCPRRGNRGKIAGPDGITKERGFIMDLGAVLAWAWDGLCSLLWVIFNTRLDILALLVISLVLFWKKILKPALQSKSLDEEIYGFTGSPKEEHCKNASDEELLCRAAQDMIMRNRNGGRPF